MRDDSPSAGVGGIPDEALSLKNVPVCVFHGAKDRSNPLANNERMAATTKRAGGGVKFTVYPEPGHNCWTVSYDNPKLYEWFLSHRKKGKWGC